MLILSIDCESSGLDTEKHQLLSVGVIVENTTKKLPFHEIPKFHCAIVPNEIVGELYAINLNRDLIQTISNWNTASDEVKKEIEQNTGMVFLRKEEVVEHLFRFLYKHNVLDESLYLKPDKIVRYVDGDFYPALTSNIVKSHLTVAGKNFATFDKLFLEKLPRWQQVFKIRQRIIDPTILFTDWKNDESLPNLSTCKERAGLSGEVAHDAIQDAWDVIELMRTQY